MPVRATTLVSRSRRRLSTDIKMSLFKSPTRVAQTGHQHRVTTVGAARFSAQKNRLAFQTRDNNARHDLTISVTYKILWAPSSGLHFFRGSARLTLCAAIDDPKLRRPHQDQTEPATTAANQQVRRWNEVHDRQSVVGKRVQKSPQSLINEARFWRRSPRW